MKKDKRTRAEMISEIIELNLDIEILKKNDINEIKKENIFLKDLIKFIIKNIDL